MDEVKETVSSALEKVTLIDLKITELKRLKNIAIDVFKTKITEENKGKKKKDQVPTDLRKCEEYNEINEKISNLLTRKRALIMDTELD
jgi:hypothetical protein